MDSVIFFKPLSASVSRPSYSSGGRKTAATSLASTEPVTSGIARDNARQISSMHSNWEVHDTIKVASKSYLTPAGTALGQRICRDDLTQVQEHSTIVPNDSSSSNKDDDDEFPTIDHLVSDRLNQRGLFASAELSTSIMSEKVNKRTQEDSPVDCRGSTSNSCQDPIWLSDDESDTTSQLDDSDLDLDFTAEADSNRLYNADKGQAGEQASNPGAVPSNCLANDACNINNNKDNEPLYKIQVQSPIDSRNLVSICRTSVSHQANELQRKTKVVTNSTKHVIIQGSDDPENYIFDVFAGLDDGNSDVARLQKQRKESTLCLDSNTNRKISEVQDAKRDHIRHSQPTQIMAAVQQSDLKNARQPARGSRANPKGPKNSASAIKLTARGSTSSAKVESSNGREPHSGNPITDPDNLWTIHKAIGQRIIRGKVEYCVDWEPTWELESNLEGEKELLDRFKARLQNTQGKTENSRKRRVQNRPLTAPKKLWKIRDIIGQRIIGATVQYSVDWMPTWKPASDFTKEELIEFQAQLKYTKGRGGELDLKRERSTTDDLDIDGKAELSKRRRRM